MLHVDINKYVTVDSSLWYYKSYCELLTHKEWWLLHSVQSDDDLSLPSLRTSSPLRPHQWGYWRVMLVLVYKFNWAEKTEAREYSHCLLSIISCLKVNCFTLKLKAKAKHQNEEDREGRFLFQTFPVGSFLITKYWHFNLNKIITSKRWVNLFACSTQSHFP